MVQQKLFRFNPTELVLLREAVGSEDSDLSWIQSRDPVEVALSLGLRKQLIDHLLVALCKIGLNPNDEPNQEGIEFDRLVGKLSAGEVW